MDCYDILVNQRGEREALAIAIDDARRRLRHLCLIRLMAAIACAVELIQRGVRPADSSTAECEDFVKGWNALVDRMKVVQEAQLPGAVETVRMIASGDVSWRDVDLHICRGRSLRDLLQYGFMLPDPVPSESYARGWEAACTAFRLSDELHLLAEVLADIQELF
jgi:hypothetical protein